MRKQEKQKDSMIGKKFSRTLKNNWQLYILILPAVIYYIVFNYLPLYGIQIAFKDYMIGKGIWGSEWVGLKHFKQFFDSYYFKRLLSNTVLLNFYSLLWTTPVPVILAIFLNQVRNEKRKRFIQTMIYVPYFISTVVMAGLLYIFLSPTSGIFNLVRQAVGLKSIEFMSEAGAFRSIYIASGIWQGAGYSTILYIASLTSIDQALYEAADIDGASIWQKIRYIDLPSILPTAMMVLILDCGHLLSSSADKALLLQTPGNITKSDVIGVYVYNIGLGSGQFSYSAAIGLFVNIINFAMVMCVNKISKRISDIGLF